MAPFNPSGPSASPSLLAGIDVALAWVVRLVWLNLWWLLLSLAGGIVLGVGPATVAAGEVTGPGPADGTSIPCPAAWPARGDTPGGPPTAP